MSPRCERLVRRGLWAGAGLVSGAALGLALLTLIRPPRPRPLVLDVAPNSRAIPRLTPAEVEAFSRKAMSRRIVKAPPPAPPKPVVPPLDLVIRLSGIINYGPDQPREAFIEVRSSNQTKGYKPGDPIAGVAASVKSIGEAVVLEYDGQLWRLTDRGASPLPNDPVSATTGGKP